MKIPSLLRLVVVSALSVGFAHADVKLPAIISDHMVLEKTTKVPIWGKANPGEEITVTLNGQTVKTQTGADGKWMTALNLKDSAAGPFEMTVEGKNKLTIQDVVVGEVWVASGQSNMEWVLKNTTDAEKEIAGSANPLLRQFLVKKNASPELLDDTEGRWVAASPETSGDFTAVGYFFGKKLQSELKVPVGLLNTSWGGTPSEAWTSTQALESVPDLASSSKRIREAVEQYPKEKAAFVNGLATWIKETGHEDKPTADVSAFAGMDVSPEGWVTISLPGAVRTKDLPYSGIVWLRKDVDVSKKTAGLSLNLPINGYDSVYWNGKLLKQTTWQEFPGTGFVRRQGPYNIPPEAINEGRNVLAIRLYEPVRPADFFAAPMAGNISLAGNWQAKTEVAFPPVDAQKIASAPKPPVNPTLPQFAASYLYNGMINPILPYAISGGIWYQGEANSGRAIQYRTAFPLMIADWRRQWNQGDFPFYFCQLANYMGKKSQPGESGWAELREAQSLTLKQPNTGQAVLIDIGESGDIHPRNKKDVGDRLAVIALAKDYGKSLPWSGPVYDSMKVVDGKITLSFRNTDGGLVAKTLPETYIVQSKINETAPLVRNTPSSQLEGFAICGEDRKWVWADAKIDGDNVIVWSDKVPAPVAVRYAWADNPTCNLYNGAGLPASPFRTDDFPPTTLTGKY